MDIIENGDKRIAGILGHKLQTGKNYKLSDYTISYSEERTHCMRSTLTGVTVLFSDVEWELVESMKDRTISGTQLRDSGFEELAQNCFFIEENANSSKQYELAISILKTMSREKKGTKTYTILPTTGCNARCTYCYEEGMPVRTMSDETANRVVEFIDATRWQDEIKLVWFGGEPLAASHIISQICSRLKNNQIAFCSKIMTNGTLLTLEQLDEAITMWNLVSAQISVDGKQEDYETRKRYVIPSTHNYDTMMRVVGGLLERGIRVTLRCNYDGKNFDGLKDFFDDVKARFGDQEKLSIYPAMLFQEKAKGNCVDLYRKAQSLYAYLRELGLKRIESEKKLYLMKTNHCEADSGDKSVTIDPDGFLYHCEHLPGNTAFGSIYDLPASICSDDRAYYPIHEKCQVCAFLPECTPFFRNGCPDWFAFCREFKQIEAEESLHNLIKRADTAAQSKLGGTE